MDQAAIDIFPKKELVRTRKSKNEKMRNAIDNPVGTVRELELTLFEFVEFFWPEVSSDKFKPNWHIGYLCEELEKIAYRVADNKPKLHDLIINIPPGTTKTITCSIMFPVWCWTKWYNLRFITASYSAALSLESAEYSRDLIRSDRFRMLYPELDIKDDKDTKSNFKVIKKEYYKRNKVPRIKHGGNRYSTSVGGTLTGFHGHILIIDDPLNPEQAVSEKGLENANHWMDHTLPTRKTDKANTPTILVMQRLHQNDPSGHILSKKKKNIKHISLPGEIRNYKEQVKPIILSKKYKNELLDPKRMSWEVLKDLELDLGQYGYAGQIGQKPTPPGGGMFKTAHFQMISRMPSHHDQVQVVRYWDKAGSEGKGAFTVGVKIVKMANGRFIVEDVKRGQWSTEQREQIIRQTAEADGGTTEIGIEQEPGSGGKESAEATIRRLAGFSCFLDRPTGDKAFRADPFSVQVNNGNVSLLIGDWNHKFVDELSNFPFSTYKDQTDSVSGGFNRLTKRRVARRVI
jgi:predicted phage terminase large subunit-like protein